MVWCDLGNFRGVLILLNTPTFSPISPSKPFAGNLFQLLLHYATAPAQLRFCFFNNKANYYFTLQLDQSFIINGLPRDHSQESERLDLFRVRKRAFRSHSEELCFFFFFIVVPHSTPSTHTSPILKWLTTNP